LWGLSKKHFNYIDKEERYKWQAVKCFQDNWNIDAPNFSQMLHDSFALARNLLDSKKYFPNRMVHFITLKEEERVRELFKVLYDEEVDYFYRFNYFQNGVVEIFNNHFALENHFQDPRAIVVYLCLRYPNRYFFYKYKMFKEFITLIDFPYSIKKGQPQNMTQYFTLCNLVNAEIKKDNELLEMHSKRLSNEEFFDESFNILTQDIIYAAVQHLPKLGVDLTENVVSAKPVLERLEYVSHQIMSSQEDIKLEGVFINYLKNAEENKRIGDLGEILVIESESEKLRKLNIHKTPIHKSKVEGDGLGYDILSYDENGEEIYIEVKCTKQNINTPFFLTANELRKSLEEKERFNLYRLYNYSEESHSAKYYIKNGDLTDLCNNPIVFRVSVKSIN